MNSGTNCHLSEYVEKKFAGLLHFQRDIHPSIFFLNLFFKEARQWKCSFIEVRTSILVTSAPKPISKSGAKHPQA